MTSDDLHSAKNNKFLPLHTCTIYDIVMLAEKMQAFAIMLLLSV